MTGSGHTPALEGLLRSRGWSRPVTRMVVEKFRLSRAMDASWYRLARRRRLKVFPWRELEAEEKQRIEESHRRGPWIDEDLAPWSFEQRLTGVEPSSSVGIRVGAEVVGWVLNHRLSGRTLRFSCAFLRRDLARRGLLLPALAESIHRAAKASFECGIHAVPGSKPDMLRFVHAWCAPWADAVEETRATEKFLR
jgi:hypothetical protein